jgi:hypothetical protein
MTPVDHRSSPYLWHFNRPIELSYGYSFGGDNWNGEEPMRKLLFTLAAMITILLAGSAWKADAQTSRGAASIPEQSQNFTPIEKAACGPHRGAHCGW